jgi:hypothetical protein
MEVFEFLGQVEQARDRAPRDVADCEEILPQGAAGTSG